MKKLFLILSFLFCAVISFAQYPGNPQKIGSDSVPVFNPSIIYTKGGFGNGIYTDTTAANLTRVRQYPGAQIFTSGNNTLWLRNSTATEWLIASGSIINVSSTTINIISTTINTTTFSICNGNNVCDTLTVNTTVQNISTAGFINDSTIVLCDTIQNCDTVHIPQQQVFTAQNGTHFVAPGILEFGFTPLLHNTNLNTNGVLFNINETQTGGVTITQTHAGSNALLQLSNPSSVSLGFKGNGDIISGNTPISLKGFNDLTNAIFQFNGGITFPLFPNTLAIAGLSNKFLSTDVNGNIGLYSPNPSQGCGLIDGLVVTFDSTHNGQGVYDVSAGSACINNNTYTIPFTVLTLPQGDSTNPRQDAFVADTLSHSTSIQGTPASDPEVPQADPASQYFLTSVFINALDSVPSGLTVKVIYDENLGVGGGEFNATATGLTVNYNNLVNPVHLLKAADVGAITNGDRLTFTDNVDLNLTDYSALKLYVRLKSTFATNAFINFQWLLGTTVLNTNSVRIGGNASAYNFSRTTVGAYQVIIIPTSAFIMSSNSFDGFRITFTGANAQGIYVDWIQLQGGIQQGIGGGTNGTVTSVSVTGNSLIAPVVTNPNTNVNIALNYAPICAGCFPGNQTGGVAVPTLGPINLSNNGNFTGTLPPILLTPGAEGSILQIVSGVPTFTLLPLGYDTTFVVNGVSVIPGVSNDTLLWGGTLRQNTAIDMNGSDLRFTGNNDAFLYLSPSNFQATLKATDGISVASYINLFADGNDGASFFDIFSNDPSNDVVEIFGDGFAKKITITAPSGVAIADYIAGASTDSVVTWNSSTGILGMRNASSFGATYTSSNGITLSGTNFKLGGTLNTNPTTIATGANTLAISTSTASVNPFSVTSTTGDGILASSTDGPAIHAFTTGTGNAIFAEGGNGVGLTGTSTNTYAGDFDISLPSTNTSLPVANFYRGTSGTAAAGMGGYLNFQLKDASNNVQNVGKFSFSWTNATTASRTAKAILTVLNTGTLTDAITISGTGAAQLNQYTTSAFTGTAVNSIQSDASGNLIQGSLSAGIKATADLTAQSAAVSSVATFTPSANGTFRIGGYINITAVTAGIVTLKVTYTDENSQSVTQIIPLTIASTGAVGTTATVLNSNNSATDILIRAKSGGAITVLTTLANVATYDVGARIEQL